MWQQVAQLASRMKARYGHKIDIDTCHAAFGLHESAEHGEASLLGMHSLIVVDELSLVGSGRAHAGPYPRCLEKASAASQS